MRTRIISAFPGTGKSYYHSNHKDTTLDSDSSLFSWIYVDGIKQRNRSNKSMQNYATSANCVFLNSCFLDEHCSAKNCNLPSLYFDDCSPTAPE